MFYHFTLHPKTHHQGIGFPEFLLTLFLPNMLDARKDHDAHGMKEIEEMNLTIHPHLLTPTYKKNYDQ